MSKKSEDILKTFVETSEANSDEIKMDAAHVEAVHKAQGHLSNNDYSEMASQMRAEGKLDYLGWQPLKVEDLPSRGMFYPEGTKVFVRAATGGEIKHWSTMNVEEIEDVDAHINYVIEKCCKISIPGQEYAGGSWKDLVDIDRLYILFAIRDFTFPKGENELMFPISETEEIPINKNHIDFMNFPDELMKYYDDVERCFKLQFKNGKVINLYVSSIGVAKWLSTYIYQKRQAREQIDNDFVLYAPLLIKSFRKFSNRAYEQLVEESKYWGVNEWSALSYFRDIILQNTQPQLKFIDAAGMERSAPLTFRGGFKSIFTVSNPLSGLC
jgi:hypothetical protein